MYALTGSMVLDIQEFEQGEDDRSTSELIIEFLLENRGNAFKRGEIANAIDRDGNTVGTNLSRLKQQGLVRHRKNHWAITTNLHRLAEADRFSSTLQDLHDQYGPLITSSDDAKAWADAQPDQPHPSESTPADSENTSSEDRVEDSTPQSEEVENSSQDA